MLKIGKMGEPSGVSVSLERPFLGVSRPFQEQSALFEATVGVAVPYDLFLIWIEWRWRWRKEGSVRGIARLSGERAIALE